MNEKSQKQIWNAIASEWNKFKTKQAEHTKKFLKGKKGNILDLGSGSGRHLSRIAKGKMYLVDFSDKMIKFARKKAREKKISAEFFVVDIGKEKLPFKDNFFNAAICASVFHCISPKSQKKAVKELFRVIKPGAEAEISVWNKQAKRFKNAGKEKYIKWRSKGARYYYLFEPEEVYGLFEEAGFKITYKEQPARNIVFVVRKPSI
jgi:tRNA (uracil-5-)-methyltransferase TRM9